MLSELRSGKSEGISLTNDDLSDILPGLEKTLRLRLISLMKKNPLDMSSVLTQADTEQHIAEVKKYAEERKFD